jgi:hypothetical protein
MSCSKKSCRTLVPISIIRDFETNTVTDLSSMMQDAVDRSEGTVGVDRGVLENVNVNMVGTSGTAELGSMDQLGRRSNSPTIATN